MVAGTIKNSDESATRTTSSSPLEKLLFAVTLLLATVIYLVTRNPILGAILPCIQGGWTTFQTGLWVLRSDPVRPRARVCFTFYVAAAFWKSAAGALLSVAIFGFVETRFGIQANLNEIIALMMVVAGGVVLNTCVGLGAVYAALRQKVRVWVHPRLRQMTNHDLRLAAGLEPLRCGFNHAIFIVVTALMFPPVALGSLLVAVVTVGKNADACSTLLMTIFVFAAIFTGPILMIPCYAWLSSRIVASSPRDCWPTPSLGETRP